MAKSSRWTVKLKGDDLYLMKGSTEARPLFTHNKREVLFLKSCVLAEFFIQRIQTKRPEIPDLIPCLLPTQ